MVSKQDRDPSTVTNERIETVLSGLDGAETLTLLEALTLAHKAADPERGIIKMLTPEYFALSEALRRGNVATGLKLIDDQPGITRPEIRALLIGTFYPLMKMNPIRGAQLMAEMIHYLIDLEMAHRTAVKPVDESERAGGTPMPADRR